MPSRRHVAVTVLAISLAAATLPGFAASLGGLTARNLGAGSSIVSPCDTNGFTVGYTTSSSNVSAVNLAGIADPGCEGGQLSLTLANASGTSVGAAGPQTVPTDAGTVDNAMTVAVSPTPAASVVRSIHVVITGP
jgi:hypothetical protein